ncbi:MAG: ABC transporter substrate-binding protein [Actinobacteria bacterium]|nr:ABC transporter substrate-binding protein [Actinomycetota bacterium]
MRSSKLRWIAAACVVAALSLILAACGGGGSDSSSSQSNTTEEASTTEEGSTTASEESGGGTQTVSFQLDWTPNTNHTGLYVAQEKGLYEKAGINLEILPYSEGSADTLIGAGKADCGISFQENIPIAVAAGSSEKAVLPILQHEANALIVKEDSEFKSPKDLSGKKYGGFGIPYEVPMVNQMIEYDGGSGEVQNVILNTGAYEAVYHGQVDTSLAFRTWELIEAAERGIKLREFPVQDYGVPDTTPWEQVACPTLFMCGGMDVLKEPGFAAELAARVPSGSHVEYPDCGHAPNIERARQFNDDVLEFFSRCYPPEQIPDPATVAS